MEKKKRRYFLDEFKRQAVERVETSGHMQSQVEELLPWNYPGKV